MACCAWCQPHVYQVANYKLNSLHVIDASDRYKYSIRVLDAYLYSIHIFDRCIVIILALFSTENVSKLKLHFEPVAQN